MSTPFNKGKITTTAPLPLEVVQRIKEHLKDQPRELAWFLLSVNSALRGGDILRILISDLKPLPGGRMELVLRERKTKKLAYVKLNEEVATALSRWLLVHPRSSDLLFTGPTGKIMGTSWWGRLLRRWCAAVGHEDTNVATHSCRKTFARVHHERGARIETLMAALNHSTPRQTLTYIHVLPEEVDQLYSVGI